MPVGASGYDISGSYNMVKKWVPVGASRCDLSNQCIFVFRIVGASGCDHGTHCIFVFKIVGASGC